MLQDTHPLEGILKGPGLVAASKFSQSAETSSSIHLAVVTSNKITNEVEDSYVNLGNICINYIIFEIDE